MVVCGSDVAAAILIDEIAGVPSSDRASRADPALPRRGGLHSGCWNVIVSPLYQRGMASAIQRLAHPARHPLIPTVFLPTAFLIDLHHLGCHPGHLTRDPDLS